MYPDFDLYPDWILRWNITDWCAKFYQVFYCLSSALFVATIFVYFFLLRVHVKFILWNHKIMSFGHFSVSPPLTGWAFIWFLGIKTSFQYNIFQKIIHCTDVWQKLVQSWILKCHFRLDCHLKDHAVYFSSSSCASVWISQSPQRVEFYYQVEVDTLLWSKD